FDAAEGVPFGRAQLPNIARSRRRITLAWQRAAGDRARTIGVIYFNSCAPLCVVGVRTPRLGNSLRIVKEQTPHNAAWGESSTFAMRIPQLFLAARRFVKTWPNVWHNQA